ncbi:MAG TPA: hypothetical protein VGP73_17030 [Thermoanaerobaculia bacterium]
MQNHPAFPQHEGERDTGRLPEIVGVESRRVQYREPRIYFAGQEQREAHEAAEILVRTAGPLPVRDLSPVLFVGETAIPRYEPAGRDLYRFYEYEPGRLQEGAPIALGWPYAPEQKVPTRFRYQPQAPAMS